MRQARVVFLGENHRSLNDHQGQLEALKQLQALGDRPLLIAAEMFTERSEQALKDWKEGDLEAELWEKEWGHPYQLYRDIFSWSQQHSVELAALRPDPERAKEVKKRGPAAAVPLLGEVLIGPRDYRQHMATVAAAHMPPDTPVDEDLVDRYFTIQCFWDEYMAWRLADLAERYPNHRIAVLVGHGHLHRSWGIPWRLSRRAPGLEWLNIGFDAQQSEWADLILEFTDNP